MTVDLVLTNAKAFLKGEIVDCCFAVEEGKIQKIGKEPSMPKSDEKTDLSSELVLPGVIDSHVHLRDEDRAYKETFFTGTAAAAAGGVTTVLDMPNNLPTTMNSDTLRNRMQIAERRTFVNVGFYSEFPTHLDYMEEIVEQGAIGFKIFMGEQVGGQNIDDDEALRNAFEKAAQLGIPVAVHAEDHLAIKKSVDEFKLLHKDDITSFLKAHNQEAELSAVSRLLDILRQVKKGHIHFCHVSTGKTLSTLDEAKKSGINVTCEVTPHHLMLTKDDYVRFGNMALTLPPLRTKENVEALWKGVSEGSVDSFGSDHAPHTLEEKKATSVWDIKAGIPGLETMLPIILTMVHRNKLTLSLAMKLLSQKPSEIFGLSERGILEQGKFADLVVVDFNRRYQIDASKFKSKAKFSPFDKLDVQGKILKTYVNGQLVMDEDIIIAKPGSGCLIRRAIE